MRRVEAVRRQAEEAERRLQALPGELAAEARRALAEALAEFEGVHEEFRQARAQFAAEAGRHQREIALYAEAVNEKAAEALRQLYEVKEQFRHSGRQLVEQVGQEVVAVRRQTREAQGQVSGLGEEFQQAGRELARIRDEVEMAERELQEIRQQTMECQGLLRGVRAEYEQVREQLRQVAGGLKLARDAVGDVLRGAEARPAGGGAEEGHRTENVVVSSQSLAPEDEPGEGKHQLGVTVDVDTSAGAAVVVGVTPDTPAEKAGLQPGDVITRVNDQPITGTEALVEAVERAKPGTDITLAVAHGPEVKEVKAHVDEPGAPTAPDK
jgi:S1-C subfamily serine protease